MSDQNVSRSQPDAHGGTQGVPPAFTRLVQSIVGIKREHPSLPLASVVELALEESVTVLVDGIGTRDETDLDRALRGWLLNCQPRGGAFGQSVEATMAYESNRHLRAVAAKHLNDQEARRGR